MRRLFTNERRLFSNVRSLLSSVKCLLILFPGLGNSENCLPIQEKTLSMSHPTVHLTNSLHARTYARAYIVVLLTFYPTLPALLAPKAEKFRCKKCGKCGLFLA